MLSSDSYPGKSDEHESGEALILLSLLSGSERKRNLIESGGSSADEMFGSGDDESNLRSEESPNKKIKLPPISSLPRMNINRIVNSGDVPEIVHLVATPIPSDPPLEILLNKKVVSPSTTSNSTISWMDRYNNVRKSINSALYPSAEDVQWINEQIEEMRKKNLSPERSELLKQAMNIIAFNFKAQPTPVQHRVLSTLPSPSINTLENSPPSSPENRNGLYGNRKMKRNQLSSWMCTQRQDKKSGELPEYRIKLLDVIGFVWSKQHKQKQQQLKANGALEVEKNSQNIETEILSSPYVTSLNGRAKRNHDLWMIRYHELIQFKKRFGHLKVPTLIPDDE